MPALRQEIKNRPCGPVFRVADAVTSWWHPSLQGPEPVLRQVLLQRARRQARRQRVQRQAQQPVRQRARVSVVLFRKRQARLLPARRRGLYVS